MLLCGVAAELAPVLPGQSLAAVGQTPEGDLVLEFTGGERRERLRLAVGAERSCLYRPSEAPPRAASRGRFASLLAEEATGARVEALLKEPDERVVLLRLRASGGRRTLVAEMLGRSSNLLWLDGEDRILGFARELASEYRRPRRGVSYLPPPAGERPSLLSLGPEELEALAGSCGPADGELARALARGVRGLGALLAREMEHRVRREGAPLREVWAGMAARLRAALWDPRLYAPCRLEDVREATPLAPHAFFVAPWPLACAAALEGRPFPTLSQALELHDRLRERWRQVERARRELAVSFEAERRRLERLRAALAQDRLAAENAERYRRWGDLLLRERATLRLEGGTAIVVDRYGGGGEERIPLDPALSARENAEAMFRRYRKARRSLPHIDRRLREVEARLRGLDPPLAEARAAASLEELQALHERHAVSPRGGAQSRTLRPPAGESGPETRAREYRSSEGWTILVGRGARANDRMTFGVAGPHDFWLHAAGCAGAHVLVRNPGRAPHIPPRTLREAAALAAHFSKARGQGAVDVHYTQRRYLRRPRGAAAGQVLMKRFRTVRVSPGPPGGA